MNEELEKMIDEFIHTYQQEGMLPGVAKQEIMKIIKFSKSVPVQDMPDDYQMD